MDRLNDDVACQKHLDKFRLNVEKHGIYRIHQNTWIEYVRSRRPMILITNDLSWIVSKCPHAYPSPQLLPFK